MQQRLRFEYFQGLQTVKLFFVMRWVFKVEVCVFMWNHIDCGFQLLLKNVNLLSFCEWILVLLYFCSNKFTAQSWFNKNHVWITFDFIVIVSIDLVPCGCKFASELEIFVLEVFHVDYLFVFCSISSAPLCDSCSNDVAISWVIAGLLIHAWKNVLIAFQACHYQVFHSNQHWFLFLSLILFEKLFSLII